MRIRWIYVIAAVPTLTEFLETGRFPGTPRQSITDVAPTVLLLVLAWVVSRQHAKLVAMTGLLNRRRFQTDLPEAVERARRQNRALVLVFIDLGRSHRGTLFLVLALSAIGTAA